MKDQGAVDVRRVLAVVPDRPGIRGWVRAHGIQAVVIRARVRARDLAGAAVLERKVGEFRPAVVAVLGIGAYRSAFRRRSAAFGRQDEDLGGSA